MHEQRVFYIKEFLNVLALAYRHTNTSLNSLFVSHLDFFRRCIGHSFDSYDGTN